MAKDYYSDFADTFNLLLLVDTFLTTAMVLFVDKSNFIPDKYQALVNQWFALPIISLLISFVCYQSIKERISYKEIFYYKKWLLISIVLSTILFFLSVYPTNITPYFVLLIPFAIAFNFIIPMVFVMFPLFFKLIKAYYEEKFFKKN